MVGRDDGVSTEAQAVKRAMAAFVKNMTRTTEYNNRYGSTCSHLNVASISCVVKCAVCSVQCEV